METPTEFPIGFYRFHRDKRYNYQLNRWYSLGLLKREDIEEVAGKIHSFASWKSEMLGLAEKAEGEGRFLNAAFAYRAVEFYTMPGDEPGKGFYYDRFAECFAKGVQDDAFERVAIPYEGASLAVIRMSPASQKKGTLLIHGGFDSFIEEWFFVMRHFARNGFEVIGFEGPGQGSVLLKKGLRLDYRWEKPVAAILDHFGIEEASLLGLSMGGWFCLRAAAFEPRIKNVIASGHAVDYSRIPPAFARSLMMFFIKRMRAYTAKSFEAVAAKNTIQGWQTRNLAHITGLPPLEAFEYSLNLNAENLHCERITQNVLYLTGRNDHFIPFKMHGMQRRLFTNASSVTDRVYEKKDGAQNHCQIGNVALMLAECVEWLNAHSNP